MDTIDRGGVPLLVSPRLTALRWLGHAVSTRAGGVSEGPFASLNLAGRLGDAPGAVLRNREVLCAAAGAPHARLTAARQVLGAEVALAGTAAPWIGNAAREVAPEGPVADALVTCLPGVPLLAFSADCVLVLLADARRRAVAAVHASRKGTFAGVARRAVERLTTSCGTDPADVVAAVAPAIGPCCYEVGPEVVAEAAAVDGAASCLEEREGRAFLDLPSLVERQLRAAGVRAVDAARRCTRCEPGAFFSHRRDAGRTGRFGALIWVREEAAAAA
jgi:hypothetical protein